VRGRSCVLAGTNSAHGGTSRTMQTQPSVPIAMTAGPGSKFGGKDAAVGKTVKILKGAYKGFLANVISATPTTFTLELLARVRKIVIDRVKCKEVGDKDGAFDKTAIGGVGATSTGDIVGPMLDIGTPFLTADTPMHMQGSETPMFNVGNETPYAGNETPGRSDDIWKVNENDRQLAMAPPVQTKLPATLVQPFVMTVDKWQVGFIVRILEGYLQGQHGVIVAPIDREGIFEVSVIETSGLLSYRRERISYRALQLAEIKPNATLKVTGGAQGQVGLVGTCTFLNEEDVIISTERNNASVMFKRTNVAVIYNM
jgi:hypothetical protein